MNKLAAYNVRVYGILRNDKGEILLSRESAFGKTFTKFPGGGHEFGEGLTETLKREFIEELDLKVIIGDHFYTTDFFQVSAFDDSEQLISVYYMISSHELDKVKNNMKPVDQGAETSNYFFWKKIEDMHKGDVTYPVDQMVVEKLINALN